MQRTHRFAAWLLMSAALAGPVSGLALASPQSATVQIRVYDRNHKDYHNWDDHEETAWKLYLRNNHREYREYNRAEARDQDRYWEWRHQHPDGR